MAAMKDRNVSSTKGSRIYSLSYALSSMRANPFRALSLVLTLGLGISLLTSNIIWADTGVKIATDRFFEDSSFQLLVETLDGYYNDGTQAQQYLDVQPFVEETYRLNSTIGLFNGSYLPDDFVYDIGGRLYEAGIKDCRVIFASNDFLERVQVELEVEGSLLLEEGQALVSAQFLAYTYDLFGLNLTLGSTFDLEVLARDIGEANSTYPDGRELALLGRQTLSQLEIAGIYDMANYYSLAERGMQSMMRRNWNYTNTRFPVLGIRDAVIVLDTSVSRNYVEPDGFFLASILVRASSSALIGAGAEDMSEHMFVLSTRVEEQFNVNTEGYDMIFVLQWTVDSYLSSVSYSMLNLPIFFLALILSVFAADSFMAPRIIEVGVLRSKGASSSQINMVFLWETLLLTIPALVIGTGLAAVFAALIPATESFMHFDWTIYQFYLLNSVVRLDTLLTAVLLCIVPPVFFILYLARKASLAEIGATVEEKPEDVNPKDASYGFTLGASITLLMLVVAAAIYLPNNPLMLLLTLGLGTAAWFFIAYNGSRVSRVGLASISSHLSFAFGEKNRIAAGYLRMRRGRIIPLMLILALTISSTIAFSVQAESLRADLEREVDYAVGVDLRIIFDSMPLSYNETLLEYDEVRNVTPVYRARGTVGTDEITVTGLNALIYSEIGHFDHTSFYEENATEVLTNLANMENGIILSRYHAERWNKTIGDTVRMEVSGFLVTKEMIFNVTGLVYSAPGFGYAWIGDIPPSQTGAGFGFQSGYSGFALVNLDFVTEELVKSETDLFMASLEDDVDRIALQTNLTSMAGTYVWTSDTFDLKAVNYATAQFLNTIEGLFSIGFVMTLIMSMFALSIFLGSVVRERRKEYAIIRALGGSKRQVVGMVFSEFTGVVFASLAVSLVLGTVFGYINGFLLFQMSPFSRTLEATITIPVEFLMIVLGVEMVAMIIGAYLPAREAGRTDPAIVLRNL
ncbi:MAG: FtsX-like permease family protein [Candidatus Thorarchaeota archaeon]|nr:FtsX-like permease family protein [Candidatus Thorarchaeota archaeon]